MVKEVLALEYKVIFWHSVHLFFLLTLYARVHEYCAQGCMFCVSSVVCYEVLVWDCIYKTSCRRYQRKRNPVGSFPSVLASSRSLGSGVLLPCLPEHCGEDSFSGSVCFFSSLSIQKVWLFPQAVGCIFGCGQEDPKWERGRFLAYAQLSSWKSLRHHRYSALIRLQVGVWKWIIASESSCNADCWQKNLTCWLFSSVTCISFKSPEVFHVSMSWN